MQRESITNGHELERNTEIPVEKRWHQMNALEVQGGVNSMRECMSIDELKSILTV